MMNIEINPAVLEEKQILKNMMQFYFYDFTEFNHSDLADKGLFGEYPNLDLYWTEADKRFPYIVKVQGELAGFVLVRINEEHEKTFNSIAEFFIMKKYRKNGIGKEVAHRIFNLHKGSWEVFQIATNIPAQHFWNKTISEYTKGAYKERVEEGRRTQEFVSY